MRRVQKRMANVFLQTVRQRVGDAVHAAYEYQTRLTRQRLRGSIDVARRQLNVSVDALAHQADRARAALERTTRLARGSGSRGDVVRAVQEDVNAELARLTAMVDQARAAEARVQLACDAMRAQYLNAVDRVEVEEAAIASDVYDMPAVQTGALTGRMTAREFERILEQRGDDLYALVSRTVEEARADERRDADRRADEILDECRSAQGQLQDAAASNADAEYARAAALLTPPMSALILALSERGLARTPAIETLARYADEFLRIDVALEEEAPVADVERDALYAELLELCDDPTVGGTSRLVQIARILGVPDSVTRNDTRPELCARLLREVAY